MNCEYEDFNQTQERKESYFDPLCKVRVPNYVCEPRKNHKDQQDYPHEHHQHVTSYVGVRFFSLNISNDHSEEEDDKK